MASLSCEKWCKELDARIKRLMEAVEHAVKRAEELKYEPDENHIASRLSLIHIFPNPDCELFSGSIGNVILQNPKTEAVTIPMTATVELQDKIIAYRCV